MLISTAYLPPIAYMAAAIRSGSVCVEQEETYRKQTCRNHCEIYGPTGKQILSIPVIRPAGNHTPTRDIRIAYDLPWQASHWRSILTAYSNSPYFLYFRDEIEPYYRKRVPYLIDFNESLTAILARQIGAPLQQSRTKAFLPMQPDGPRIILASKHHHPVFPAYFQPFSPRHGFISNLSVIDLLFNLGNESLSYLKTCGIRYNFEIP